MPAWPSPADYCNNACAYINKQEQVPSLCEKHAAMYQGKLKLLSHGRCGNNRDSCLLFILHAEKNARYLRHSMYSIEL